jgi:hypothetical protein
MAKKNEGSYWSCVTNGEFHFSKNQINWDILSKLYDLFRNPDLHQNYIIYMYFLT